MKTINVDYLVAEGETSVPENTTLVQCNGCKRMFAVPNSELSDDGETVYCTECDKTIVETNSDSGDGQATIDAALGK